MRSDSRLRASRACCWQVANTLARISWARAPAVVRLPPKTLRLTTAGRMACSAGQLVASMSSSYRNVSRFLKDNGITFSAAENSGRWILSINHGDGAELTTEPDDYCEIENQATAKKGFGVAITSESMGSGDEELGRQLMKSFFITISCMDEPPSVLAFYNSGVKLMALDAGIIETVQELELRGTEVLICGTCVDYYKLGREIKSGRIADMLTIITKLAGSGNVIRP